MLTKKQIEALKKRWKEKKAIPQVAEVEESQPELQDGSSFLRELAQLDVMLDEAIKSHGPSR
jgi:hypothetical protein